MGSPVTRITLALLSALVLTGGGFLAGRFYRPATAPILKATSVEVSPQVPPRPSQPAPAAASRQIPDPPDVSGLNVIEVPVIPGIQLDAQPPPARAANSAANSGDYIAELTSRPLMLPIAGLRRKDLVESFHDPRGQGEHEAVDIMEPRGTPVLAVDHGTIVKLFTSQRGGLTIYQFDESRHYCYYYAHLDRYAEGAKEGTAVRPGEVIGYVGSTGNAVEPHLHFALSVVGGDGKWWTSTPLDPYPVLAKLAAP